jgi:hypothetical protein
VMLGCLVWILLLVVVGCSIVGLWLPAIFFLLILMVVCVLGCSAESF